MGKESIIGASHRTAVRRFAMDNRCLNVLRNNAYRALNDAKRLDLEYCTANGNFVSNEYKENIYRKIQSLEHDYKIKNINFLENDAKYHQHLYEDEFYNSYS